LPDVSGGTKCPYGSLRQHDVADSVHRRVAGRFYA
jgi:hypothetical protein